MIRQLAVIVLLAGMAAADPYAGWDTVEPRSKAKLETQRLALTTPVRLVAIDTLDDGTTTSRIAGGKLHALTAGTPKSPTYWWRGSTLMASDAEHVATIATTKSDGHSVLLAGSLYFVADDKLTRFELAAQKATALVAVGKNYDGAIATDGKLVYVADRAGLWTYDPNTDRKTDLPQQFYWPGALAFHAGRFLIDIHGHGAAIFRVTDKDSISLGTSLANPSGVVGWANETAIVLQTQPPLEPGAEATNDTAAATEAITCWRAARDHELRTLYRTAPGVSLCDVRVEGKTLAWLEYRGEAYCANPEAVVTAKLVGACE